MEHLTYQETQNRPYQTYFNKFRKMVKEDLSGDGWFLLVKDFPFKDGPNLMFTAGENIGKWEDKNLVSLYGKRNFILGRCRKRGPVLTLMDFQDGDYIKEATESGLRKDLKAYFKGTGVTVRVFRSLKVSDPEPELTEDELREQQEASESEAAMPATSTSEVKIETLEMPALNPNSIKALLSKAVDMAKALGVDKEAEFNTLMGKFAKAVPQTILMKKTLEDVNAYLQKVFQERGVVNKVEASSEGTTGTAAPPPVDEEQQRRERDQLMERELKAQWEEIRKLRTEAETKGVFPEAEFDGLSHQYNLAYRNFELEKMKSSTGELLKLMKYVLTDAGGKKEQEKQALEKELNELEESRKRQAQVLNDRKEILANLKEEKAALDRRVEKLSSDEDQARKQVKENMAEIVRLKALVEGGAVLNVLRITALLEENEHLLKEVIQDGPLQKKKVKELIKFYGLTLKDEEGRLKKAGTELDGLEKRFTSVQKKLASYLS